MKTNLVLTVLWILNTGFVSQNIKTNKSVFVLTHSNSLVYVKSGNKITHKIGFINKGVEDLTWGKCYFHKALISN
jgi:hypothetical protein